MAEVYIVGQILSAENFREPNLFARWNIQAGKRNFASSKIEIYYNFMIFRIFVEIR